MSSLARLFPAFLGILLLLPGCSAIQQFTALSQVDFSVNRLGDGLLAGIDLNQVRSYNDLNALDAARLISSVAQGELPLGFTLHLDASNPSSNSTAARLVQLDWTLLIDESETVSGIFNDNRLINPGETADIPISMELDLVRFFGTNAQDVIDLALNLAGAGGNPARVSLRARPTVNTALGPISYPGHITISHTVGG